MSFERKPLWSGRATETVPVLLPACVRRLFSLSAVLSLLSGSLQACMLPSSRREVSPSPPTVSSPPLPQSEQTSQQPPQQPVQVGEASWYGSQFHGKLTSSGTVYNQHGFTAAHPTLPEGSRVRVTNLDNGKSVTVRVNDRGPFVDGRIIDVSRRAAKTLGILKGGTAKVQVKVLSRPKQSKNKSRQHQQQ